MNLAENIVKVFDPQKPEKGKKVVLANISSYEGKNEKEEPKYSSWRARFVGTAFKPAQKLGNGDRIKITSGKVENFYDKENQKLYVTLTVFDFDFEE